MSPLVDSRRILRYIDSMRAPVSSLQPEDCEAATLAERIIELVHSDRMSTNLILLQARDAEEMRAKQSSIWKTFVENRYLRLKHWRREFPDVEFYRTKLDENTPTFRLYAFGDVEDDDHKRFYANTHAQYRDFAAGIEELNGMLKLPYCAGETVASADLHVGPWLCHAMWGAGCSAIDDFAALESLVRKSVPSFRIGDNIKEWWAVMIKRASFRSVYPELH